MRKCYQITFDVNDASVTSVLFDSTYAEISNLVEYNITFVLPLRLVVERIFSRETTVQSFVESQTKDNI